MAGGQGGRRKPVSKAKPKPKATPAPGAGTGPTTGPAAGRASATVRRQEAAAARRRRDAIRRNGVLGVIAVLFLALGAVCFIERSSDKEAQDKLVAQLTAGDCDYDTRRDSGGADHIPNPAYEVNPPAGGDHTPQSSVAGVYQEGQVPPDGPLVHAQEHGFIVFWYKPGDEQLQTDLEALGDEMSDFVLVVPRTSLPVPVAATAWHRRLLCPSFESDTLREFAEAFKDKGPEKGFVP